MEKSCPGKESHPPSSVSLRESLYEIKLTPLPEPRAYNSARACSDCLSLTELPRLSELKCLYGEKLAWLREGPYHWKVWPCLAGCPFSRAEVNGLPNFARKCEKRWLAQVSSGQVFFIQTWRKSYYYSIKQNYFSWLLLHIGNNDIQLSEKTFLFSWKR